MNGTQLTFYLDEGRKHRGHALYEWILRHAQQLGIHGGSAFRGIAGFGRHGVLHEDRFFELQGDLPVEVVFVLSDADAQRLLDSLKIERIQLFYVRLPVEFGVLNPDSSIA